MDRNPILMIELSVIQSVVCNRLNIDSSVLEAQIVLDYIELIWTFFSQLQSLSDLTAEKSEYKRPAFFA